MQKRQKKRVLNAEMNVVPYIDVMLVLLVIFMVTAPMLTQGIKVNLPNLEAETLVTPKDQKVILRTCKFSFVLTVLPIMNLLLRRLVFCNKVVLSN